MRVSADQWASGLKTSGARYPSPHTRAGPHFNLLALPTRRHTLHLRQAAEPMTAWQPSSLCFASEGPFASLVETTADSKTIFFATKRRKRKRAVTSRTAARTGVVFW